MTRIHTTQHMQQPYCTCTYVCTPTALHLASQGLAGHFPGMQHQGVLSKRQLRGANEAAGGPLHRVTAVHIRVDLVLIKGHKHMLQRTEPTVKMD